MITEQSLTHLKNIVIHEFAHILGFNNASWKFFRFPGTGKPRTSRPFVEESFICVDGRTHDTRNRSGQEESCRCGLAVGVWKLRRGFLVSVGAYRRTYFTPTSWTRSLLLLS